MYAVSLSTGVSRTYVRDIVRRVRWKNIND